ncbi:MAG TPA: DUF2064 domain-containing protein [Gaiellales bacterium]
MTVTLALIAKEPGVVRAKTRLAATLGDEAAERFALALLLDSVAALAAAAPLAARLVLAHDPPDAAPRLRALGVPARFDCVAQGHGTLGDRLARLMADELAGGATACVIAATDSPFALGAIADCVPRRRDEIVLAPCRDGGYWAVGAARTAPIFAVPMSTDDVLEETIAAAVACGCTVRLLPPTLDIDTECDLEAAAAENLLMHAPRTAAEWQQTPIAR